MRRHWWLALAAVSACGDPAYGPATPADRATIAVDRPVLLPEPATKPCPSLHEAARSGDLPAIDRCLASGADVDAPDERGDTALLVALDYGEPEAAARLLDAGASLSVGRATPLHLAARDGHDAIVRRLLELGASASAPDSQGHTPLHHAAKYDRIEAMKLLLEAGADVDAVGHDGFAPLHTAAAENHAAASRLLVERGASLSLTTRGGESALFWAVFANRPIAIHIYRDLGSPHDTIYRRQEDAPLVELLVDAGASLTVADSEGRTALHAAAIYDAFHATKILLSRGASTTARDGEGKTPLDRARERGHEAIAALLQGKSP